MNRMRLILLAAALVAALLAAYLSMGILRRPAPEAPQPAPVQKSETVDVVVASRNIEPGEKLDSLAIQWRAWPREVLAADMISRESTPDALETLQDARALGPILAGEPIVNARIVAKGQAGFLSAVLPAGMRAVVRWTTTPSRISVPSRTSSPGVAVMTWTSCPAAAWRTARARTCVSMPPSRGA